MKSALKWCLSLIVFLCALYLLLLIPDSDPPVSDAQSENPFAWKRDDYWSSLESRFGAARIAGCDCEASAIAAGVIRMDSLLTRVQADTLLPTDFVFSEMERTLFSLSALMAACPSRVNDYLQSFGLLRRAVKDQSVRWNMNSREGRDCIYKLLYGGRTAVEEVMLQSPGGIVPQAKVETREISATPSVTILDAEIHSGDILVSRGGAPTSALIARGNDYPGNFSHCALVYVDPVSGRVSIIESHIEKGVAVANIDDYLKDTKLRVMVLRMRSDHPALQADPMLPHKAAATMLGRAESGHIPYDFAMNVQDDSKMFCSEVVAHAYSYYGVKLWAGLSRISSVGARSWLSAFGVRNFTTEEPSDLEYDPQLRVVAEWRDSDALYKDRLDNAVVDVMLESADSGAQLQLNRLMLPVARVVKAYSFVLNQFGFTGPIPEGMTATAALRNKWFSKLHRKTVTKVLVLAQQFKQSRGYSPPYWELVRLARQAYASAKLKEF